MRMSVQQADRSGKVVVGLGERSHESARWSPTSTIILRGDNGPNGCGMTTSARARQARSGEGGARRVFEVAYFDRLREQLDQATVQDNLAAGRTIVVGGMPRHVLGYLGDWLFSADRARHRSRRRR